ncbi:peptide/nickel transport system permease protein [Solirubrobacter pauli]|uniref:Peptide/nickel transport system permease protein n=1 Tax=Solirubrobacter pauli TaxID=166793 RepID=A0A660LEV4_9ACTN|nr:ABC transporter permease [Solirubrobacter pauli]RKQ92836.1 peptide/nickel transport system permease protein [Solirubrobacter pauli]
MLRFFGSRLAGGAVSIFGASLLAFLFLRKMPGDPARLVLGPLASDESIAALRDDMGLNDPVWTQYWHYVRDFFTGDWGFSYSTGQDVSTQISNRLPASVELGLWAFLFAFVAAIGLALLSTYRHRPVIDGVTRAAAFVGLGTPPFWLGLMLLVVFFSWLGWFPGPEGRVSEGTALPPKITGMVSIDALLTFNLPAFGDAFMHLFLPAISLGLGAFALLVRLLRANLHEVGREPFLVVSRSKGLSRWSAHARHALPNAFLPTLTAGGLLLAQMIGGSVLVEKVYNWPGVGTLVVDSILRQDFSVVQAFILLSACAYVVVNLLVDVLYGVLDPRVRSAR